ncbi:hypothetical protein IG631_21789 [Alternaria alternata]|nr:hypothetical protein IG631_21789 [Alternaria alternata]
MPAACSLRQEGGSFGQAPKKVRGKAIDAAAVQQPASAHRLRLRINERRPSTGGPL